MSKIEIESFFADYASAFNNWDAVAVANLWSFPALISTAQRGVA